MLATKWTVDASAVRIAPMGVATWIAAVNLYLLNCSLQYMPSQLGMILEYDELYKHGNSQFNVAPIEQRAQGHQPNVEYRQVAAG